MKKHLLFILLLFSSILSEGSVIYGAEMSYRSVASKKFEVTLKLYRPCLGVSLGNPSEFSVVCASGGTSRSISYSKVSIRDVTPFCGVGNSPCSPQNTIVSNYGVEEHTFKGIVDFNVSPLSTDVSNGCCEFRFYYQDYGLRTNATTTGTGTNHYVDALVNVCQAPTNSSPEAQIPPLVRVCCSQPLYYSLAIKDTVDGDSLAFRLVNPKINASTDFTYGAGYSAQKPFSTIGSSSAAPNMNSYPPLGFGFDTMTGAMAFYPNNCSEIGPLAVRTYEYRKDSTGTYRKIGETVRDMTMMFNSCGLVAPPYFTAPLSYNVCAGNTLCFNITTNDPSVGAPPPMQFYPGDTLLLGIDYLLPGASFSILDTSVKFKTGRFCWTPDTSHIRTTPHSFTATVKEKKCSSPPLSSSMVFKIKVHKNFTATRTITKLSCGKYVLSAIASDSGLNYTWTIKDSSSKLIGAEQGSKNTSYTRLDTIQFHKSGRYIISLSVTNQAGCPRTFVDTIRTDEILGVKLIADTLVCRGVPATLTPELINGNGPIKYKWISTPDQAFNDSSSTYTFQPKDKNNIQLTVTDSNKCFATASGVVNISGSFSLGMDTQICHYDSLALNGPSKVLSYTWSPISSNKQKITVKQAAAYILSTIDSMGCVSADTININISKVFQLGADTFTCSRAPLTIEGPPAWTHYKWNTGFSGKDLTVNDSGKYILTTTDDYGCVHKDSILINNYPRPDLDFNGGMRVICKGGTVTLDAGPGYSWYYWNTGQTSQSITVKDTRTYTVAVLNEFGCGIKDSITTIIDSIPAYNWISYALAPRIFEFVPSVIGPFDYLWDFGDGVTSKAVQTSHHFANPGVYNVCLILKNGNQCSDTICKTVQAYGVGNAPDKHGLSVYPNPFNNTLSFSMFFDKESQVSISIYDLTGREISSTASETVPSGKYTRTIDLNHLHLSEGVYQAKISINSIDYFIKLVHLK